jgi:hypothetical protein
MNMKRFKRKSVLYLLKLIKSMGLTPQALQELIDGLQDMLPERPSTQSKEVEKPSHRDGEEYGDPFPLMLLFEDGTVAWRQRYGLNVVGVVVSNRLVLGLHHAPNHTDLATAKQMAAGYTPVQGHAWRVLTTADCFEIKNVLRTVNRELHALKTMTIVESSTVGVLTSDGSMEGAVDWQVWFATEL